MATSVDFPRAPDRCDEILSALEPLYELVNAFSKGTDTPLAMPAPNRPKSKPLVRTSRDAVMRSLAFKKIQNLITRFKTCRLFRAVPGKCDRQVDCHRDRVSLDEVSGLTISHPRFDYRLEREMSYYSTEPMGSHP